MSIVRRSGFKRFLFGEGQALSTPLPARLSAMLLLLLTLAGCAAPPVDSGDDAVVGVGRSSPEAAVDGFLEDLNRAMQDPSLASAEKRRGWAERLAGYFAPGERIDQRAAFIDMLAGFADTAQNPVIGTRAALAITYTRVELISREGDEALVRVVDGAFDLRWLDAQGEILRERTGGLTEIIGQTSGGLPVLRVDGLWFLTER